MDEGVQPDDDGRDLRILVLHGRYRSSGPSGENEVVDDEIKLLREHGCHVDQVELESDEIATWPVWKKATLPGRVVWSRAGQRIVVDAIRRHRPDVLHIHNTFPLFSPAAFWAASSMNVPIVHTLHNFRPFCPAATFLRDGRACEDCFGRFFPWPAIQHGCYRDSRLATLPVALMDGLHQRIGTWQKCIDRFIVVSGYERERYIEGGWPADKIKVKFNTVWEAAVPSRRPGPAFLCMSRLSPEKGVEVLLEGWRRAFPDGDPPVHLTASGPLSEQLQAQYGSLPGVTFLGHLDRDVLLDELSRARAVVLPSRCYEGFPRVVVEAYAARVPIVASRVGSLTELVEEGVTGLQVAMGDPDDMARALKTLAASDELTTQLGQGARERFERLYSPEVTMRQLLGIYREAIAERRARGTAGAVQGSPAAAD